MTVTLIDIQRAIDDIKNYLDAGDCIQVAKKKACGSQINALTKRLSQSEKYLIMLNEYLERNQRNFRFMITKRGLKMTSIGDYEILKQYGRKRDREPNFELPRQNRNICLEESIDRSLRSSKKDLSQV